MNNLKIKQVESLREPTLEELASKRDEWIKSGEEKDLSKIQR